MRKADELLEALKICCDTDCEHCKYKESDVCNFLVPSHPESITMLIELLEEVI